MIITVVYYTWGSGSLIGGTVFNVSRASDINEGIRNYADKLYDSFGGKIRHKDILHVYVDMNDNNPEQVFKLFVHHFQGIIKEDKFTSQYIKIFNIDPLKSSNIITALI